LAILFVYVVFFSIIFVHLFSKFGRDSYSNMVNLPYTLNIIKIDHLSYFRDNIILLDFVIRSFIRFLYCLQQYNSNGCFLIWFFLLILKQDIFSLFLNVLFFSFLFSKAIVKLVEILLLVLLVILTIINLFLDLRLFSLKSFPFFEMFL
jgi:hypothetical protein